MSGDTISSAEYKMLERIFSSEIDHALRESKLPFAFQSKAKVMNTLNEKGLVEQVSFRVGNDAMTVHVVGWVLTHSGRFTYCANC